MNNNFILKDDERIYWIQDMPKEPVKLESFESYAGTVHMGGDFGYEKAYAKYLKALQSAISNAVEVSNQGDIFEELERKNNLPANGLTKGTVYSLQCSVEKRTIQIHPNPDIWNIVALVTFPESGNKHFHDEDLIQQDLYLLGMAYKRKHPSGQIERIPPEEMMVITRPIESRNRTEQEDEEVTPSQERLTDFLLWVEKNTYYFEDKDVTPTQVANEYLNTITRK